jgi:hypothetical protein
MLPSRFDEYHPIIFLGLAAVWLSIIVLLSLWASRTRRRRLARIVIAASFVVFLVGWMSNSFLTQLIGEAIWLLLYPANHHYSARETAYVACGIILVASNVVGTAGIWASLGRSHWFMRILAIAAISPLLLVIRAYEPCVVFLVQSVVTVVPLVIARKVRGWEPFGSPTTLPGRAAGYGALQFGILHLLALTLLVATVLGIVLSSPEKIVVYGAGYRDLAPPPSRVLMGVLGVVLGFVMLLAAWVTLSRRAWWLRIMGLFLAWPGLLCMLWLALWREAAGRNFRMQRRSAADGCDREFASPRRRALGRVGLILLSLLILVPLAVVYYHLAFPPPITDFVITGTNGYDDLLAADITLGKTLRDQGTGLPYLWREVAGFKVPTFQIPNRKTWNASLQEVHAALDRPSRVPLHYRAIEWGRFEYMDDLASALTIEGQTAAGEGRITDAIRCFTDIIRLGRATGKGGLSIDWLANCGLEMVGVEQFHNLANTLDAAQCRMAIKALAAEDKDREPFEDVWRRDRVWAANTLGWSGRLYMLIGQDGQRVRDMYETDSKERRSELRIAMTELAVHAYFVDHKGLPKHLSQLVPDYLPTVPVDPLTDKPPVYELNERGYLLYSPRIELGWAAPPPRGR